MTEATNNLHLVTRVIHDETEWDAIRGEWDALYLASPMASAPLDFAWLRTWWIVYNSTLKGGGLRIVTVWRGVRLIAAIPLYIRQEKGGPLGLRRLSFISTGEAEFEETCADYLNLLCMPDEVVICTKLVWQEICRMDWDHLELLDLPENTPLLHSLSFPQDARRFSRGKCPVANLEGGFEAYLQKLSPNRRQQARRLIREGERVGVLCELVTVDQVGGAFGDLIRLHQERWKIDGKMGVFGAPRFVEFHRAMISQWLSAGRVVVARLSLATKPVAILYGFITARKFDFYQSGVCFEPAGALRSPGNLAHLLVMRELSDRGVTEYDFLRGASPHKERHATSGNELIGIELWRPTLRSAIYRMMQFTKRAARKAIRLVR